MGKILSTNTRARAASIAALSTALAVALVAWPTVTAWSSPDNGKGPDAQHQQGDNASERGQEAREARSDNAEAADNQDHAQHQSSQGQEQSSQGQEQSSQGQEQSSQGQEQAQDQGQSDQGKEQGNQGQGQGQGQGDGQAGAQQQPGETHPPGNNGFVQIEGMPFEDFPPNNEPHPGCVFRIDFYNYDEGDDLFATYILDLHPPTGTERLIDGSVFIGEDPAGGGTDLDASVVIDPTDALIASGAEPHPQQGFHVKLTVHADGSIGADTKHKVFWVDCPVDVEVAGPTPTPTPTPTPPVVEGIIITPPPEVLGIRVEREVPPAVLGERLAVTGASIFPFVILGLTWLASGALLVRAARRRDNI